MRTSFALAALAASSTAIDLQGAEQFTAGLFEGLIGKNDLPEIQQCMTDDQTLFDDINTMISDIEQGSVSSIVAGIQEGIKVAGELPNALTDCQNISDDITKVENYFSQFADITGTAEKIFKNILTNFRGVSADISSLESDYNGAQYFQAGQDLAQLMVDTLGPIQAKPVEGIKTTVKDAEEFIAGFIQGMVGNNDLPAIKTCMTDEKEVQAEVQKVVEDVQSGDITSYIDAAKTLITLSKEIPSALSDCKSISSDVDNIKQWASQFTDAKTDAKLIVENALKNYKDIMAEGSDLTAQIKSKNWQQAGQDAAALATDMLGPITVSGSHPRVAMVEQFLVGFVGELMQLEDLKNLEACVTDVNTLQNEIDVIIEDVKQKDVTHILQAITVIGQMASQLPQDVAECKQVQEGLPILKQWAELFKHPKDLAKRAAHGVFENYPAIYTDALDLEQQLSADDYITAGKDIADIVVLALGENPSIEYTPFDLGAPEYLKLIEGLLYGLVQDENLLHVETCINDAQQLESMAQLAVGDFEAGGLTNYVKAVKEIGIILSAVPGDLQDCKDVTQDIDAIKAYAENFTPQSILSNVVSNFQAIVTGVPTMIQDINNGSMEQAGEDIAKIISLVVGPVE